MISTPDVRINHFVRRSPIFYGWIVWAVAALGTIATSPGQSYSVSLFFDYFIADFGLDRTTASGLYGLGTFLASLALTWIGRQVDRYGNRRMNVIVSVLFALVLIGFSFVAGPLGLLIGFIAIRGLGQGSLSMINSTVVAQWFKKRRGRMMSLTLVVMSLFQSIYVPWLQGLLETYGWRQVWVILGIGVALSVLPLSWLLMRDRPEDFDLKPDNEKVDLSTAQFNELDLEDNWRLSEALRTTVFWMFTSGRFLISGWGTGLVIHQVSLFGELGHSPAVVAETYSIFAILTAVSALAFGYLIDRFRPSVIIVIQMAGLSLAMLLAMGMTERWMLLAYAFTSALAMGGNGVFEGAVWPNLFGRKYLGEIRGFTTTLMVAGSALGPVVFGFSYDYLGGYTPVLWMGIVWAVLAAVGALFVNKPQRRGQSADEAAPQ